MTEEKVAQQQQQEQEEVPKRTFWVQIRLFPIWLRIILVLALVAAAMAAGVMVGYGVIGDGEARDALKWSTWDHVLKIMNGE
ncbi:DNA-directed RNA polymerase subunit beta [Paenisporosarcina cavernae]|uniref:DNA-directed RNA polymerase subunit beta n=1 Tax=Paenisporosarcina cavernae TaxID=2320858 RepID=A0A385YS83_9BACL|nr:DNA-directed RNA polymerase subunit beta [Paenisporosarcina cavernae]AYC28847.1 DNA-directed RNA polymerase subunit beta [Paenisporosarcina cavernae]